MLLWFDVEQWYEAIKYSSLVAISSLWFDVEQWYEAMHLENQQKAGGCGLM